MGHIQPDTTLPKTPKVKVYKALITQSGTSNPSIVILQNTMATTITIIRQNIGYYEILSTDEFKTNKTFAHCSSSQNSVKGIATITRQDDDTLVFSTIDLANAYSDGILSAAALEINVYE